MFDLIDISARFTQLVFHTRELGKLKSKSVALLALLCVPHLAQADEWWFFENTRLVNASSEIPLTDTAKSLSFGGYELAGGDYVTFRKWYKPKRPSFYTEWRTEMSPEFGFLWGFSTGEQGKKYTIDPALSLGLHYDTEVSEQARFSLVARTWLWGALKEKPCKADYGAIAGTQKVHCRLAASTLPPEETLDYLARSKPERFNVQMQYAFRF